MDAGDLLLLAVLLFLYVESKDEDFLVILIAVGVSIFKKDTGASTPKKDREH